MPARAHTEPGRGAAWMAAVKAGDQAAFRALVEHYQPRVVAFCLRFVGDPALAGDLAQEVFLTLWRERARYDERGALTLYVLRIARLRCLAALKRRRSRGRLLARLASERDARADADRPAHAAASPADALAHRQDAALVRGAIARLAPRHAELVILRYLEGLDLADIAAVTGIRAGTIKSRLGRALAALRKELAHARDA